MSKNARISLIVCSLIFGLVAIATLLSADGRGGAWVGLFALLFAVVYVFAGIILCLPPATREAGKGMLLAGAVLLLVGFTVCSASV